MSDKRQSDFIRSIVDPEGLKREEELHKQFIQAVPEREVAKGCPRCAELQQDLQTTADALGHMKRQFEAVNQDRDDWIACHAKIFRELQEAKSTIAQQAERIKELEGAWEKLGEQCVAHTKTIKERDRLAEQLAAAEKDVKRLNDLETLVFNGDVSIEEREPRHSEFRIHTGDTDYDKPFVGRTLREAIDAAAHRKGKS